MGVGYFRPRFNRQINIPAQVGSGGAPGADSLVERYAVERNRPIHVIAADWEQHGPRAGFIRNRDIVDHASMVIAFHDGISVGTKNTIDLAKTDGIPVHVVSFKTQEQTKANAYYSDKPMSEKQVAFLRKHGSKTAVEMLNRGDNRKARIYLDITFDKVRKEKETEQNGPALQTSKQDISNHRTEKSPAKSSGPEL